MATISNKAVETLREQLVQKCFEAGIGFRICVSAEDSGEGSFSIKLDRQHEGDKIMDSGGIKVFWDPASAARISGYQLDFQDESAGGFFLKVNEEEKQTQAKEKL